MAEVPLPKLLAHLPEKNPPWRWWALVLPAAVALLAIVLATTLVIDGSRATRTAQGLAAEAEYYRLRNQITELEHIEHLQALLEKTQPDSPELATLKQDHGTRFDIAERLQRLRPLRDSTWQRIYTSYHQDGRHFTEWDGYRYEEIIEHGYIYSRTESIIPDPVTGERRLRNVAWYPLYPTLGAWAKQLTGWPTHEALTLTSRVCAVLAAMALFSVARRHFHNRIPALEPNDANHVARRWDIAPADTAALWTVALLYFGPCAVFLYANYTESLFLLLLGLFLLCLQRRWWMRAALVAAVASACRSQGVLFGPLLALSFLLRSNRPRWQRALGAVALGAFSGLGLMLYMRYLDRTFGDPLAFVHAQQSWQVGINWASIRVAINPMNTLGHFFLQFFRDPPQWPKIYEALMLLLPPVALLLLGARFLSFEMEALGWLFWALPYVSQANAVDPWMSMARYQGVSLPLFVILGAVVVRFRWLGPILLGVSAAVFGYFSYLYGTGQWVG